MIGRAAKASDEFKAGGSPHRAHLAARCTAVRPFSSVMERSPSTSLYFFSTIFFRRLTSSSSAASKSLAAIFLSAFLPCFRGAELSPLEGLALFPLSLLSLSPSLSLSLIGDSDRRPKRLAALFFLMRGCGTSCSRDPNPSRRRCCPPRLVGCAAEASEPTVPLLAEQLLEDKRRPPGGEAAASTCRALLAWSSSLGSPPCRRQERRTSLPQLPMRLPADARCQPSPLRPTTPASPPSP